MLGAIAGKMANVSVVIIAAKIDLFLEIQQTWGPNMKRLLLVLASAIMITGCAKRPDAIVPVAYPIEAYASNNCQQLSAALSNEERILVEQSKAQNQAANGDAVGVFLIGVPTSSLTGGDQEGNISVTKGKIQTIRAALASKGCVSPAPQMAQPSKSVAANM